MSITDQAAGLREWQAAGQLDATLSLGAGSSSRPAAVEPTVARHASSTEHTLMVVGAPGSHRGQVDQVSGWLRQWQREGNAWVGYLDAWRIVPVATNSTELPLLAASEQRWGLWVGNGPVAFRQAFSTLAALAENGGPRRLLALHAPGLKRRGLLHNLQQAAEVYFGIELLVLAR